MLLRGLVATLVLFLGAVCPAYAASWTDYDRPAEHGIVEDSDVPITMRDGIVLVADVRRPDGPGRYPVLVVQTPYNKDGGINAFLGGLTDYFVQRGYVTVTVDVRGTGGSQGQWDSFGEAEQRDGPEVVEWAAAQPWSDGNVGLFGPSYMGLNQLFTAAQRPPHLKAIFPIVPMADAYRDITFSGGQVNVSFIPLWLGLVTGGSLTPPGYAIDDPVRAATTLAAHGSGFSGFQARTVLDASTGGSLAYDGPFWKLRSPLEVVDRIEVPAFVVGGHHDLFQRGEPLVYERLKKHVPARLLMGPWTHVGGSTGEGLPRDGVPALRSIALRWFDRYLRGVDTDVERIPKVTQYVYGQERYVTQADWPDPRLTPRRLHLRDGRRLAAEPPAAGEPAQTFLQQPASGVCTQSTSQWTAGLTEGIPCTTDNRLNESLGEAVYTTAPLEQDLDLSGPLLANLWVRSSARDAVVAVRLTDVAPDGRSTELTAGWLAGSFRAVDDRRSRFVRGRLLQPWHPFTADSAEPLRPGQPTELPVEIFPVRATIKKGHSLRLTVGPGDFPHQLPPLPQLTGSLAGRVEVLTGPEHASYVELPTIGKCLRYTKRPGKKRRRVCRELRVPRLVRG